MDQLPADALTAKGMVRWTDPSSSGAGPHNMHLLPVKHEASTDSRQDTHSASSHTTALSRAEPVCDIPHASRMCKSIDPSKAEQRVHGVPSGHPSSQQNRTCQRQPSSQQDTGMQWLPAGYEQYSGSPCGTHQLPVMPWLLHMPGSDSHRIFEGTNSTGDTPCSDSWSGQVSM